MKRLISLLLIVLYSAFNAGLVVNKHYCSGRITSVSFFGPSETGCSLCGKKKMAKNCCQNKQVKLSADDTQLHAQAGIDLPDHSFLLSIVPAFFYLINTPDAAVVNKHSTQFYVFETGPPKTPVYIQIRSLIL